MKRCIIYFVLLVAALHASADVDVYINDFKCDGIAYSIVNSSEVVACMDYYEDQSETSATIPEKVSFNGHTFTVIGLSRAFRDNNSIQQVTLPNSLLFIKDSFEECKTLNSLTIPSSVISFVCYQGDPHNYFENIKFLKIDCKQPPFTIPRTFLDRHYENTNLIVPAGCINAYKSHPVWGKFKYITDTSAVNDIKVDDLDEGLWYDLNGHSYDQKPTDAGIYIHNHNKVIVK